MSDKLKHMTPAIAVGVISIILSLNIFVQYPQMTAYAVSKDTMQVVIDKLDKMDTKLDRLDSKLDAHLAGN